MNGGFQKSCSFYKECCTFAFENPINYSFMRIRRALLLGLAVFSTFVVEAQDLIVKQNGETIKAYRTDVGNNAVYYRLEDDEESPL
ncbi:MAG: hypothetical protein II453_17005, partial [Alphaproteobacteria bacterium]|nr:hypothetical protein [Alphaproteobacteria bacterium]